ncbi:MAG: transglycosylase domain-containing protein [Lachnospiraceae bacterium]|nr:transglycosylase domain-containing protein [Lachnospiraceae bacterium]
MDFSKNAVEKKLKDNKTNSRKYFNKVIVWVLKIVLVAVILLTIFGLSAGVGVFMGIIDNTPEISMESIVPMGYATTVYNAKGQLTDTLVMEGSNRAEVTYDELPQDLIDAFVAIEDSRFWEHNGIDTRAIFRAAKGVLTGNSEGGGSTITQQLIKNNVFNGGFEKSFGEKLERKFQEQYLAVELEKVMDKKLILTNYLNTINLGNNSLGVKVAAKRYFDKDVSELTLSECAVIAGITQNPSKLNPITGKEKNAEKREVILQYMEDQGYISEEERLEALEDPVYDRIQNVDIVSKENIKTYSYFTDELVDQVTQVLKDEFGYTDTQAHNMLYSGGLSIYTTQDPDIQEIVDSEVNNPDNYVSSKYAIQYRLSVKDKHGETSHYSEKTMKEWAKVNDKTFITLYETEEEAKAAVDEYRDSIVGEDDEVVGESLVTTLEPQVSFVIMDHTTGYVKAISGGRGTKKASLTLNRATNSLRQPGSTFKVISAFGPAIDACGATLATVYYDAPYTVGSKTFRNWYSSGYAGWCNIRDGIVYSMNIIAVRCLIETVGPELAIDYCRRLGITTLTDSDYNAATALGGITLGVSNLELTGAYAAIANNGKYIKPKFFTKILDHNGKVIYEVKKEPVQVFNESTAFLLTDAMKDSMLPKRLYTSDEMSVNSTSTAAHLDGMSCAGKSGTTTNSFDIWFAGFTPYYTATVWAGYDNNENTLSGQTSFHKQIWKNIMTRVHEGLEDPGFPVPESVTRATVCRKSGFIPTDYCALDTRGNPSYTEYFAIGTEPHNICNHHTETGIIVPDESEYTDDLTYIPPEPETETVDPFDAEGYGPGFVAPRAPKEPEQFTGPGLVEPPPPD